MIGQRLAIMFVLKFKKIYVITNNYFHVVISTPSSFQSKVVVLGVLHIGSIYRFLSVK